MKLHRAQQAFPASRFDEASARRQGGPPMRDTFGRSLEEARLEDQRDYLARKRRVEELGWGEARLIALLCGLVAATIPFSIFLGDRIPPWWPLGVIAVCTAAFALVTVMRWLLEVTAGYLGVNPPKPPEQTSLQELRAGAQSNPDPGPPSAA